MIKVEKLSYSFPTKDLYNKVSFSIEDNQHAVLIGSNGTGKTTLAQILMNPDDFLYEGKVNRNIDGRIGYVSQLEKEEKEREITVFDYLAEDFVQLQIQMEAVCAEMETAEDFDRIKPVGESYHLISESGQTISYREIWYDNPEQDTPQQPIEVIKNGITLDSENHQNTLYVNEKGEYLLNPNRLFMISNGQGYISKSGLAQALVKVGEGRVEQRGHLSLVAAYIFFYALGTAILLWPEKMAFLGNRWRYRSEPELSDEGLVMEMLGGVVIICMAVVIMFFPLVG